jgi:DNA-binding transcriptional ArsR family regulator
LIEWRFTPDDVARIRLAFSPLGELVRSLIVLRAPARHSLHLPWVKATRPRLVDLDLSELFALVPIHGDTADFLTPPPTSPLPDLDDELVAVRHTPADRLLRETVEVTGAAAPIVQRIRQDPAGAARRITETLQTYWNVALAEHWPRIQALLEADVLWRSQRLAIGGARALFEDLHETVRWHGDRVGVADRHHHVAALSGQGLVLTPSAMCWPAVRKMIEPYQPTISYPARAIATLWETGSPAAPAALATLIGRTRASLLIALAEPTSTSTLARRLSITPGAVSQHLAALLNCGLATRARAGRSVLYQRTRTGDVLVADQTQR